MIYLLHLAEIHSEVNTLKLRYVLLLLINVVAIFL